jgi:predicted glycosyltransferase
MARARPVTILFYAINGRGLGHLVRLLSVARAARELLDALEVPSDFQLVTTSEASFVAEDFPVYKLPSKTALATARGTRERHVQNAKLLVSNLVAAQSPDLLVLDTVPYGAFQELAFLKGYARATAYVYRHLDEPVRTSELVQRHLELFDRVLVPDERDRAEEYPVPRAARERVAFVGPIHAFDAASAWSRERVRAHFAVPDDKRLVYVSAGGGGDGRERLEELARAVAADARNFVLAGFGPLHRGELCYAPNLVPLTDGNARRFFLGLDAAVSAGGYNSHQELLAAGVPTLFFAQPKGMDRQDQRIVETAERGLCAVLPEGAGVALALDRLEELLTGELGTKLRETLRERAVPRGALLAAVELLLVCASLADTGIDRAAVLEVAAWRRDATRELAREFVANARAYRAWRALAASAPELAAERDAQVARWWGGTHGAPEPLAAGAELRELADRSGADPATWSAILAAFARHPGSRSERVKRSELLDALRALDGPVAPRLAVPAASAASATLRDAVLALVRQADALPRGAAE